MSEAPLTIQFIPADEAAPVLNTAQLGNVVVLGSGAALLKSKFAIQHSNTLLAGSFAVAVDKDIAALQSEAGDAVASLILPLPGAGIIAEAKNDEPLIEKRRTLTFAALSDVCSRHNAPGRPDLIPAAIGKAGKKESISLIHVVVERSDQILSAALAVSRAFPMYTAKKNSDKVDQFSSKKLNVVFEVTSPEASAQAVKAECQLASHVYDSVRHAARLVDKPTCEVGVDFMVKEAMNVADNLKNVVTDGDVDISVIRGEALREKGFGGIWGVGKGARELPAFVHLSYKPKSPSTEKIAFIGKGIVYDTGGLALKTADGMFTMKTDMAGSAGVLYAFNAAVRAAFDSNSELHALLCLAENAIGPDSYRNGDILRMLSKKTVEVNNTDAEGRIVMADAIFYASSVIRATTIVDMATLTGAQGIATGQRHAAIYCNEEELEIAAVTAGKRSGDLVHPLPYAPEFFREEFSSPVADMRNSVKNRFNASSACAGQFLANHLDSGFKGRWLHIDMASPSTRGELSTGYGVGLLTTLIHKNLRTLKFLK